MYKLQSTPRIPPRAANSHSSSVASLAPRRLQYATASLYDTCTAGWSGFCSTDELGPAGRAQYAPSTGNHHSAPEINSNIKTDQPQNTNAFLIGKYQIHDKLYFDINFI